MGRAAQVYDLVAGGQGLTMSRYMTPTESRRQFPTLAQSGPSGRELKGTARALAPSAGPAPSPWAIGRTLSFDHAKQAPGSGWPPQPPAAALCRACAHLWAMPDCAMPPCSSVRRRLQRAQHGGRAARRQPCSCRGAGSPAHAGALAALLTPGALAVPARRRGERLTRLTRRAAAQIVYYDGQFNDSRFNVALALTAAVAGATVLNYAAVEAFLKVGRLVAGLG